MYCHCGCGQITNLVRLTDNRRGIRRGEHRKYIMGHNARKSPVEYIVDGVTGCWVWQRAKTKDGYASVRIGRKTGYAHRVFYERCIGPIPEGLVIDHLCLRRDCVNPDHLEPVTIAENLRRAR